MPDRYSAAVPPPAGAPSLGFRPRPRNRSHVAVDAGTSNGGPSRSAGVKDVAAAAGVSVGTVSNVLNRPQMVRGDTRLRVEQAMKDLGFVRNESARQLRAGRSSILAYVMLDATNPFFTDVGQGIEDAAEDSDVSLFLCNSDNRLDRELGYLIRLQEQRVQGILITPTDPAHEMLEELPRQGIPLVLVDRVREGSTLCSVAVDDRHGGALAIAHLLDLGHERVAFVGGPSSIGQVRERLEGARRAMVTAGRAEADLVVIPIEGLTVTEGRSAGERIAGMPRARRPSAAFCANDLVALGLLQQCVAFGIRVPEDLAIVGYDDIDFAAAAAVPLTSVRQPRRELGRTAGQLLLDEAVNPDHEHQHVLFTPELVARASTRRARPAAG